MTAYPLGELVVTVASCAAIFVEPLVRVPKGIVEALVPEVMLIVAPLTEPEVTAARENENVGSTEAVMVTDVAVSVAKAIVVLSIAAAPASLVVRRTKVVVLLVVGLVIPAVTGTVTAVLLWEAGVATVRVMVQSVLPVPVQVALVPVAVYPEPPMPVTVPRVGDAVIIMPVGAVQVPEAAVQYWKSIVFIFVEDGVVNTNVCALATPDRESLMVSLALDSVAARAGNTKEKKDVRMVKARTAKIITKGREVFFILLLIKPLLYRFVNRIMYVSAMSFQGMISR